MIFTDTAVETERRNMDIRAAQAKRVREMQTQIDNLTRQLAERDAEIRRLKRTADSDDDYIRRCEYDLRYPRIR